MSISGFDFGFVLGFEIGEGIQREILQAAIEEVNEIPSLAGHAGCGLHERHLTKR
jgi:hypothetical protein